MAAGRGLDDTAGVDMEEWSRLAPKEAQEAMRRGQDALWAFEHLTKPTIAALAGVVRGAGTELALACDVRIADESAVFSHPEVDLGWMPSHGGTARLSRLVGRSKALEILLAGKEVKALDALRRHSLAERTESGAPAAFTLQSVVLEYVTDRLVEDVADDDVRQLVVG